jgi:Secretion system C-terminal sorting domain
VSLGIFYNLAIMKKTLYITLFLISSFVYSQINYQRTWATYYGGRTTITQGAAIDSQENVYVASFVYGTSPYSNNFVTPNAFLTEYSTSGGMPMITKFNANGQLVWSTFFSGEITQIGVDKDDNIYIAGSVTNNPFDIATPNCFQPILVTTNDNPTNGYIAKFNPNGQLLWATYYPSEIFAFCTDSDGNIYISGWTDRLEGMTTQNAYQENFIISTTPGNGLQNGFLAKFDTNGNRVWATYYGLGSVLGLAVDEFDQLYVAGQTLENEPGYYATTACFQSQTGVGFLSKFDAQGQRVWSTYYNAEIRDLQVNRSDVYFAGIAYNSPNLATENAYQTVQGSAVDIFLTKFTTSGEQVWSTYYGGNKDEGFYSSYYGRMISFSGNDVYLTADTQSQNNIATPNSFKDTYTGGGDITDYSDNFIVKFNQQGERQWATYYGGERGESNSNVLPMQNGSFYTCGTTESAFGMATVGAQQPNLSSYNSVPGSNAYLARFDIAPLNNATFDKNIFSLYPNPSNGNFTIKAKLKDNLENGGIIIYDNLGREIVKTSIVINQNTVNQNFNFNSILTPGIYFLKIIDNKETLQTFKIIIN